ncbi:hypothetical protein TNIN_355581, partial [Trichonephila inaurata madagascariensis]
MGVLTLIATSAFVRGSKLWCVPAVASLSPILCAVRLWVTHSSTVVIYLWAPGPDVTKDRHGEAMV